MRKILIGLVPAVLCAAFAVAPAVAQAATKAYGVCETGTPHTSFCPAGQKFVAFANGASHAVTTTGGKFVLESEAGAIECTTLKDTGTLKNEGGVGHSEETLTFTGCTFASPPYAGCLVSDDANPSGTITSNVTDLVTSETTVEISVVAGSTVIVFDGGTGCPPAGTPIGEVTGKATGTQAVGSNELVFSKAAGLFLEGAPATITGKDTATSGGKPVYIN